MVNILKSDFYKLSKNKAFWICTLLSATVAVLVVVAMQAGINRAMGNVQGGPITAIMADMVSGAGVLTIAIPMGFHLIFIAVFVSVFVASEFQTGTIKNVLSRGAGRTEVFFSKFITTIVASLIMLTAFVLGVIITGTVLWGFDPNNQITILGFIIMLSLQSLTIIAFAALFTFTSMTLRGTGGAVAANVISVTMASTLFTAVSLLLPGDFNLSDYWLEWGVSNLATYAPASADVIQGIIIAVIWGVMSLVVGAMLFNKQDIN